MKIPAPKFPKRVQQSFSIQNAAHLFGKLSYEIHHFTKDHSLGAASGYLALNIAMTAWHMVDWLNADMDDNQRNIVNNFLKYKDKKGVSGLGNLASAVAGACNALRMCQVITNAGKHVKVTRNANPSLITRPKSIKSNQDKKFPPELSQIWVIVCDGKEYLAEDVFREAVRFWEVLLSRLGIIEDRYIAGE